MNILVTGATGFIGGQLVKQLIDQGYGVRCIIRPNRYVNFEEVEIIQLQAEDFYRQDVLIPILDNIDIVYNFAGLLGRWGIPDQDYWMSNVELTKQLLLSCQKSNIKRFIHGSTVGVLGPGKHLDSVISYDYAPSNIYEKTKAEAEHFIMQQKEKSNFEIVVFRPAFVFGPGDSHVLKLFQAIQSGRFVFINNGKSLIHPVYIDELIYACLTVSDLSFGVDDLYTITGEHPVHVHEFVFHIQDVLEVSKYIFSIPTIIAQKGASVFEWLSSAFNISPVMTHSQVDFFSKDHAYNGENARRKLKIPAWDLRAGIENSISYYKENNLL